MGVRVFHLSARRAAHQRRITPLLTWLIAAALAAMLAACSEGLSGPSTNGGAVARVIIAPDSVALPRGQTMRLEALLVDGSGTALEGRHVRWTSSAPLRVPVTSSGTITASDVGWSLVSAASEGKADTVKVIVTQ